MLGYGRLRIAVYIFSGVLISALFFGIDRLLESLTGSHNLLFLIVVPLFAAGLALLARQENHLYHWGSRLDEARKKVNDLLASAAAARQPTSFYDGSLDTCWQQLDCDKTDCPVYGQEHARCWLIAGTFCRGQVQGKFAKKLEDCRHCEIYQRASSDPVNEITESFYAMNYLLSEREEQLEEAYNEARARSEKLAGLVALSEAALSSLHQSELLQNLLESTASIVGADMGAVSLIDSQGERLETRVTYGIEPGPFVHPDELSPQIGEGLVGAAFAGNYIAVSESLDEHPQQQAGFFGARTFISLPLVGREQSLGMLTLATFTPHRYSEEEKDSLCVAANRIAAAIESTQLASEITRDRGQMELMSAVIKDLYSQDDIHKVYESFVSHASRLIKFDRISLDLWHADTKEIEIVATNCNLEGTSGWLSPGLRLPQAALPIDKVLLSQRPLIREDIKGDEYPIDKLLTAEGVRSCVLVPLISKGELLGIIRLGSLQPHAFTREDVEILEPVARQLGLVLDNVRLLQQTKRLPLIDGLTKLYNHRYFYEAVGREIARSERYGGVLSLILVDIDGLRNYNEACGHIEGDNLLREIAQALRSSVRDVDVVARYGGDEFAILLPEVSVDASAERPVDALQIAHRLRSVLEADVFHGREINGYQVTISMGLAGFPQNAADAAALLERADAALRQAKERGSNRTNIFLLKKAG